MSGTCDHASTIVLFDEDNVSVARCTWGCGAILISVKTGITTATMTAQELARLRAVEEAAREYEKVTTYIRYDDDCDVCAHCDTGLGTPHKKDCRASLAHKALLAALEGAK